MLLHADVAEGDRDERIALQDHEPMRAARARFVDETHCLVGARVEPT